MNSIVNFTTMAMISTRSMTLYLPLNVCEIVGELAQTSDQCTAALTCRGNARGGLEDNIWHERSRTILARDAGLIPGFQELTDPCVREAKAPAGMRAAFDLEGGLGHHGRNVQPVAHGS